MSQKKNLPPGLDLEGVDDLGDAGDEHHDADDQNARHGRAEDAAERDDPGDEVNDAEGDDPPPFGVQRRERRNGPETRRCYVGHVDLPS